MSLANKYPSIFVPELRSLQVFQSCYYLLFDDDDFNVSDLLCRRNQAHWTFYQGQGHCSAAVQCRRLPGGEGHGRVLYQLQHAVQYFNQGHLPSRMF